jgi:hypothetical protein
VFTTWTSATAPAAFARQLGLVLADAGGTNEIRSQYAGFFLAAAVACALAIFGLIPDREALVVLAVIFGGLFVGRLFSVIGNGGFSGYGPTIRALCVIDAVGTLLTVGALAVGP